MDQSRLEELRKLLQKRHQEPKRGLEQNSNCENFEAPNSETKNSEASNSETLNSDPDALNLEAKADQNSTCENNAEPQNFTSDDSGSLRQNSKTRNYDKEPIIIKDNSIEMIKFYSPFLYFLNFIDFGTRQDSPRSVKRWLGLPSKFGT